MILDLQGASIGYEGWLAAFVGTMATLVLCEAYKALTATGMPAGGEEVERSRTEQSGRVE